MTQHDIAVLLEEAAKKMREGQEQGKFFVLAAAILSSNLSGGHRRINPVRLRLKVKEKTKWLLGGSIGVPVVLVQGISTKKLVEFSSLLTFFENIEILKDNQVPFREATDSALRRISLKAGKRGRISLKDAISAILEDPAPS